MYGIIKTVIILSELIVHGGFPISGTVSISGSKNAALPIMAAAIAVSGKTRLKNIPHLSDVEEMTSLLRCFGCEVKFEKNQLDICSDNINNLISPYELVTKFRASFLVSGALLSRFGYVRISLPGGCRIGTRPVDLHIKGLCAMGAKSETGHGYMEFMADKLKGAKIYLDFPSVGATENLMTAACLADGITEIENAATEPEVTDLANFLIKCGAKINGVGTEHITICGVDELKECEYSVIPDRIEAGTYMIAAACTGGAVTVKGALSEHLNPIMAKMRDMGVKVNDDNGVIRVESGGIIMPTDIKTLPHPGFPTDMQSVFSALMCYADGTSMITETIFENRFMHMAELMRMHATIKIDGRSAVIEGHGKLDGARVEATDLRAGAALAIAGMAAVGTTEIGSAELIYRGYENFDEKLRKLGAQIERRQA